MHNKEWQGCNLLNMSQPSCHNPDLGLTTKARAYKVSGQKGSLGVTLHAPGSVRKCERMNPHTFKAASNLGIGIPLDSQIFREQLQESKLNR
jgi:hypothetical protein